MSKSVCLVVSVGLLLCSCAEPPAAQRINGRALEITLEGVTVRQYRGSQQRFTFDADRLVLYEDAEVLEAPAGVQGRIEAGAFPQGAEGRAPR